MAAISASARSPMTDANARTRNLIALALLILGKVLGIVGLIVGTMNRLGGGILLGLDGAFLVAAVVIALGTMRRQNREETTQKELLARMMREGTLDQFVREVREAERARKKASPDEEAEASSKEPSAYS